MMLVRKKIKETPYPYFWRFNLTCRPWTDEKTVRGSEREAAGLSFPSCRPDTPHQWIDLVLHISSTRSMVLSLQHKGQRKLGQIYETIDFYIKVSIFWRFSQTSNELRFFYLQLVILQMISKGSSRFTVSGITSKDSLMSPYPGAWRTYKVGAVTKTHLRTFILTSSGALRQQLLPFFVADWSEASPSPRDLSSIRCQACLSPSHLWWRQLSLRTLALV